MISSITSMASSSSSATVRVDKATSEFLIGPDWTLNIDICDTINSNQMLAKDVVKAVKKRLQHKNPKVQLLALTLLETMVKNCGDYVHFQIAERNILQEMVKIVRKRTDMHVRDKILILIGSWHEAFGGPGGRYPQYYMAYEDLQRSGVEFPQRPPDAAPIFTPPVTHPISGHPQSGYGMPSSSSMRLDEVMAADETLSLSSLNSMRDVLDLLTDMLQAVDPGDRSAVKDEVIIDLVEQCRANQRKLMQLLGTIGDEELLCQGLELNDSLQSALAKHDSIASGSATPPKPKVEYVEPRAPEKYESGPKSTEINVPNNATSNDTLPASGLQASRGLSDEEDEEDDFAQLARRHTKTCAHVPCNTSTVKNDNVPSEGSSSPVMSNALVPINAPLSSRTKDQDIMDLLSITLSTDQPPQAPSSETHTPGSAPSTSYGVEFPSEINHGNTGLAFNSYVAPWAQTQPNPQPQPLFNSQLASRPQSFQSQPQPQDRRQNQYATQPAQFPYPPPPWAATPGYFNNRQPYKYSNPGPSSSANPGPMQHEPINGEKSQAKSGQGYVAPDAGQKPFIPSYRLFEDLNVFGKADGRYQGSENMSSSLSGANNNSVVGGRK
ncbi:hypothetical protein OROGR_024265 [Orobanche gracilis]